MWGKSTDFGLVEEVVSAGQSAAVGCMSEPERAAGFAISAVAIEVAASLSSALPVASVTELDSDLRVVVGQAGVVQ